MKPHEFWASEFKDVSLFVEMNVKRKEDDMKEQVILLDALGDKIIMAGFAKKPKGMNLPSDRFKDLFKEELEAKNKPQSIEEQIRNLRARRG